MPPKGKILVVDDEADFRAILRVLLEREGYVVAEAQDGQAGLEAFEREAPDLILLDISMPVLDGLETCKRLRAKPGGRSVPVLHLTVRSQIATVAEGLSSGANDYVLKPFEPADLLERVARALGHGADSRT